MVLLGPNLFSFSVGTSSNIRLDWLPEVNYESKTDYTAFSCAKWVLLCNEFALNLLGLGGSLGPVSKELKLVTVFSLAVTNNTGLLWQGKSWTFSGPTPGSLSNEMIIFIIIFIANVFGNCENSFFFFF